MMSKYAQTLSYHSMLRANCGEIVGQLHGAIEHEQVHFQQRWNTADVREFLM